VKDCAKRAAIENLAAHDLRRTCARLCRDAGGELDQIQDPRRSTGQVDLSPLRAVQQIEHKGQ
jgi:hypothetical protein